MDGACGRQTLSDAAVRQRLLGPRGGTYALHVNDVRPAWALPAHLLLEPELLYTHEKHLLTS